MTEDEIKLAYLFWRKLFLHRQIDVLIEGFLPIPRVEEWIRIARRALFLRVETVAERMKISPSRLSRLERDEKSGKIQISTLREIAAAMDCELEYAIRPKSRKAFSAQIWPLIYPDLLDHHWLKKCDQRRRAGALALLAKDAMLSPKYRRAKGWCRKA